MKNRILIALTATALIACLVGLFATIHAVWPVEDEPASVEPAFVALGDDETDRAQDAPEPGQSDQAEGAEAEPAPPEPDPPKTRKTEATRKPVVTRKPLNKSQENWKAAVLQVVTDFETADVKVNGLQYPEYFEPGEPEGMVLPAGGPYHVEVTYGDNVKHYRLNLRPYETRLLLVDLTGYNSSAPPPPPPKKEEKVAKKDEKKDDKKEDSKQGKITVYSKPAGVVVVDGKDTGEKTPGSVELDNGRHEVQVKYETGSISEKKIVRVRSGSRIKLFFRERK